jgi:hypothetical protein
MAKFFFRGLKEKYSAELHANGFYVATDTHELIAGGVTVGINPEQMQTILDFMASKGQPNGLATLDENGKVPVSQLNGELARVVGLESFVADRAALDSIEAEVGDKYYTEAEKKIYTKTVDGWDEGQEPHSDTIYNHRLPDSEGRTNVIYRWDGQTMVEISASIALGEVEGTAYEGSKGKANADKITKLQSDLTYVANTLIPEMNTNTAKALAQKVDWDAAKKVISLPADGSISALRPGQEGVESPEGGVLVAQRQYDSDVVTEIGTTKNKLTLNSIDGKVKVDYPGGSKTVAYAEDVATNEAFDELNTKVGDPGDGSTVPPTGIFKLIHDDEVTVAEVLNDLNERVGETPVVDQIQTAVDALKGGVSTEYDTLKKIEDLLKQGDTDTLAAAKEYTDASFEWFDVE